jgi:ferredoxin--NADP+ reductase
VAARLLADLALAPSGPARPGRTALAARLPDAVDHAGWTRIDAAELAACGPGRCRHKIAQTDRMLAVARKEGHP